MNELFTFNTNQFQASVKRPSSTDNPPNIRKRIIKSIISKRLSQLNDPSLHRDQGQLRSINKRHNPVKKVTFNLEKQDAYQEDQIYEKLQITKKGKLSARSQAKSCVVDAIWKKLELNRFPLLDIKNERKGFSQAQRPLSNADNRSLCRQYIKNGVKQVGELRQKRIISLKLSPKIVPVSDNKLPKAFKIKYMVDNNLKKSQRPKMNLREILSCEIDRKLLKEEGNFSMKMNDGGSQHKNMLLMQEKLFQKLYHPRQ